MAGSLWFVAVRAAAARFFLAALVTVVLIVTAGVTTMTVFLADAAQAGIRSTVDAAPANARAVVLTTELGADETAQSAAAARLFASAFGGAPIRVDRAVAGVQLAVDRVRPGGSPAPAPVMVEPRALAGLAGHARIVAGSWPAPPAGADISIAVPADPTASTGWRVGERATIAGDDSGTVLRVAALYRPFDLLDPYFLPQPGGTSATPVLVAVGEHDLTVLASSPSALWTISADTSRLRPADALPLSRALAGLGQLAGNDPAVAVRGVRLSGGLPATLTTVLGSLDAARGVAVLPVLLTAGLGLVLIVVLLAALTRTRREEFAVLRGRGLGSARLTAWSAAEGLLLAVPAALAGIGVSVWFRTWAQSPAGSGRAGPIPWWPAVLVCAVVVAASVALTLLDSRSTTARPRSAALGSIVPVVLLLAAGAVSVWRFRSAGSAVVTDGSGTTGLDPVAAPAPAVGLVALALLGTLLAAVAARAAAAAAGRRRGLTAALPVREVSRRWATFGAAVTVVSLTVAAGVLTAGYDGTQRSFADASALLSNSADVRVDLPGSFIDAGVEPAADRLSRAAVGGARQSTAVLAAPVTIGSAVGQLVAVSPVDLTAFLPAVAGGYDPAELAGRLASPPPGPRLPPGASAVTVRLSMTAAAVRPDPRDPAPVIPAADAAIGVRPVIWLATPAGVRAVQGDQVRVPVARATAVPVPATRQVTIPLPADLLGSAATVVAVDTVLDTEALDTVDTVRIDGIPEAGTTTGAAPVSWTIAALQDDRTTAVSAVQGARGEVGWDGEIPAAATERTVRLLPLATGSTGDGVAGGSAPVRMVINRLMADQVGATVGGALDFRLDVTGAHVLGTVVAISPVLPGEEDRPRAFADRTAVAAQLLSTTTVVPAANEVWISTAAPGEVATRLRGQAGPGWVVSVAGERSASALIDPARTALWLGAALFLLLALIALGLLVGMSSRDRRGEIRPLMALGLTRRQWVALRRWELWWCFVVGAVLGLAVGVSASALTVGGLARSAVVGAPAHLDPVLEFSTALWPALAAAAVGALVVLVGHGRLHASSWVRAVR